MQRLCGGWEKGKEEELEMTDEGGQSERRRGQDRAVEVGRG